VKDSIEILVDSLSGELTQEQIQAIEAKLEKLRIDSAELSDDYSIFKAGKVRIDEIMAPGSIGFAQFEDTVMRDLSLPVDMHADTTTFYMTYQSITDTIQLYYHRDVYQSLEGFRMRITNIGVNEEVTTFDSLQVECDNKSCSNDQTTIYIYF